MMHAGTTSAPAADPGPCSQPAGRAWCDQALSVDQRAQLLMSALTPEEKIRLLAGTRPFMSGHTGATAAIPRVGLPESYQTDGAVGIRQGKTTLMPSTVANAAAFNPEIARLQGATIAAEAKAKGNDGLLAPTVNMLRTPLNGRTYEAFGEDPYLTARNAVAYIEGVQKQGVYATIKHFAANNQEGLDVTGQTAYPGAIVGSSQLGSRYTQNSIVDDRTLREIYLPQFEAAVKEARVGAVMCSYNRLNGPYACSNDTLLNGILKREWGFKNMVEADYIFATHPTDTAPALTGGLDLEMPAANAYQPTLVETAVRTGQASQADIDEHARRILRTLFEFGFFDRSAYRNDDSQIDQLAHSRAAQRVAEAGVTMLKNEGSLPLDGRRTKSIAVVGPFADKIPSGGGSGQVTPFAPVTPLAGIRARAGSDVAVSYADGTDQAAAVANAKTADIAIVFVADYGAEGADRQCLGLACPNQGDQDGLIDAVASAQPNTVVVLQTAGPTLTPWRDKVDALLEAWYPGQSAGPAIARVLFGDVDPGGRLPVTFPKSEGDLPTSGDLEKYPGVAENVRYKEGVLIGYRWFDERGLDVAYPFGHGLSYTNFAYSGLRVKPASDGADAEASVVVRNTGKRAGIAVPQLYLGMPEPRVGVVQPPFQLKGFDKVELTPRESRRVSFTLDSRAFSYWDTGAKAWQIAAGCYRIGVGASSRDLPVRGWIGRGADCGGALELPRNAEACTSRRVFTIRLPRGTRRKGARVTVAGRRAVVLRRGSRLVARIDLRSRAAGRVTVRVTARGRGGARVRQTRVYRTCARRSGQR